MSNNFSYEGGNKLDDILFSDFSVKKDLEMHRCESCGEYFKVSEGHSHWCMKCYCLARRAVSCFLCGEEMNRRGNLLDFGGESTDVSISFMCNEDFLISELKKSSSEFRRDILFDDCLFRDCLAFDFGFCNDSEKPCFLIENDGYRHFRPVRIDGCSDSEMYRDFIKVQIEDWCRERYCFENDIPLVRVRQTYCSFLEKNELFRTAVSVDRKYINRISVFGVCDTDVVNDGNCTTFTVQSGITCTFKCDKESHSQYCQNWPIRNQPVIDLGIDRVISMYDNGSPLSHSITFQGLEPLDNLRQLLWFIYFFRKSHSDRICIWTGYTEDECGDLIYLLKDVMNFENIVIKFGRFVPGCESHFDNVLKLNLASPNQYAVKIS